MSDLKFDQTAFEELVECECQENSWPTPKMPAQVAREVARRQVKAAIGELETNPVIPWQVNSLIRIFKFAVEYEVL